MIPLGEPGFEIGTTLALRQVLQLTEQMRISIDVCVFTTYMLRDAVGALQK